MKILLAIPELGMTGAVIAALDAVQFMIGRGHGVVIWTPQPSIDQAPAMVQRFAALGSPVTARADVADFNLFILDPVLTPKLVLASLGKCAIIGWIHEGWIGVRMARENPEVAAAMNSCTRLIFPTEVAARGYHSFLHSFPKDRVTILPYAVRPAADCPPAITAPGKTRIVFVGSIYPRKRPADLITAVAALKDPAVECFLIGDIVNLEPEYRKIVADNPATFIMRGPLDPADLQRMYRSVDIFSLPSDDESFGIAPLEAALHHLPVVLSDLDCYEGLWRHGQNCLIHPTGDIQLLGALLKVLIDAPDMRKRLGAEGAKLARTFNHKRFFAGFELALDDTMASTAAPS